MSTPVPRWEQSRYQHMLSWTCCSLQHQRVTKAFWLQGLAKIFLVNSKTLCREEKTLYAIRFFSTLPELLLVKNIKLISIVSKAISEDQTNQSSSNNPWLWYHSFAGFSKGEIPVFETFAPNLCSSNCSYSATCFAVLGDPTAWFVILHSYKWRVY